MIFWFYREHTIFKPNFQTQFSNPIFKGMPNISSVPHSPCRSAGVEAGAVKGSRSNLERQDNDDSDDDDDGDDNACHDRGRKQES
jgi:hypothetical protein